MSLPWFFEEKKLKKSKERKQNVFSSFCPDRQNLKFSELKKIKSRGLEKKLEKTSNKDFFVINDDLLKLHQCKPPLMLKKLRLEWHL